jgi:uncharacterized sporulation protein YeaH/YhbH (DUF444 family)
VHPGNQDYLRATASRAEGGGGGGGGSRPATTAKAGRFRLRAVREEFMHYFFEDLELPRLVKTKLLQVPNWKNQRAGYSRRHAQQHRRGALAARALGRRIALGGPLQRQLAWPRKPGRAEAQTRGTAPTSRAGRRSAICARASCASLHRPLRPALRQPGARPASSQAVMFCLMDVSGSMDEQRKDLSKRFFILLYLFLTRNYEDRSGLHPPPHARR